MLLKQVKSLCKALAKIPPSFNLHIYTGLFLNKLFNFVYGGAET